MRSFNFSVIVFDTAPTGHTLRLLNFPNILEKGLGKLVQIKEKFGGLITQFSSMLDPEKAKTAPDKIFNTLDTLKTTIEEVNAQFKDPSKTTFIAVCIPEFLSLYETERLVVELAKYEIDIHNIILNNVLFPDPSKTFHFHLTQIPPVKCVQLEVKCKRNTLTKFMNSMMTFILVTIYFKFKSNLLFKKKKSEEMKNYCYLEKI